jgi:hypothetical protein
MFQRGGATFHSFPLVGCIIISIVFSVLFSLKVRYLHHFRQPPQSTLSHVPGSVSVKGMDEHHMRLRDCHNFHDFRRLARSRIPGPIFDYIDGAADDEVTYRRNTESFER